MTTCCLIYKKLSVERYQSGFISSKRYILFIFRKNCASNIATNIFIIFATYNLKIECMWLVAKEEIVNRECMCVFACSMLQSRYLKSRANKPRSRERQVFARSTRLNERSNLSIIPKATSASDLETVNAPLFLRVLIKRLWQRLNSLKSRVAIMVVFRIAAISLARHEIAERRVTVLVLRQIADDAARSLISIRGKLIVQGIAQPCLHLTKIFHCFKLYTQILKLTQKKQHSLRGYDFVCSICFISFT